MIQFKSAKESSIGQKVQKRESQNITIICSESEVRRKGREYLNDIETRDFTAKLNNFFEAYVGIPRIRVGKRQTIETLINGEALILAKFIRNEKNTWIPRLPELNGKLKR